MGYYNLLIHGVYWGYNPLILTFDPNFQWEIQVLHFRQVHIYVYMGFHNRLAHHPKCKLEESLEVKCLVSGFFLGFSVLLPTTVDGSEFSSKQLRLVGFIRY